MTVLSNRNMKNRRYRGQALLVVLLGALTLSGCAVAPAGDLENFEPISLGDNPAPAPTKTFDPEGQEYANDPSAEVDIEDQSGDGLLIQIDEIKVGRANAFLVIYDSSGLVIAQTLVTPQSQPVNLVLDSPLTRSQDLQAALYLDNGDGVFQLDLDLPLLGEEGELVHEDFYYKVAN